MSEETAGVESAPEGPSGGVDPVAVALALGGASQERADAFLKKQEAFIDLQAKELAHELGLRHWSLRVRHLSGLLKLTLEISAAVIALVLVCGAGAMVWNAAHADGLVIEAFSVPPDLAAKGMTGQVVASLMLDKLNAMQNATGSLRPAKSYSNNWGDDLKVEIPDTGISLGEVYRFLRGWLGQETRISGEVYWIDANIAVNVRASGASSATFIGPSSSLDALVQKASEKVYGDTQPYRYANYLSHYAPVLGAPLRPEEAKAIFNRLTGDPNPLEQGWAWAGLGYVYSASDGNLMAAAVAYRKSIAVYPNLPSTLLSLAAVENYLGDSEQEFAEEKAAQRVLLRTSVPEVRSDIIRNLRTEVDAAIAYQLGDYAEAGRLARIAAAMAGDRGPEGARRMAVTALAAQHDGPAARAYFGEMPPFSSPEEASRRALSHLQVELALENWRVVMASEASVEKSAALIFKGDALRVFIANGPRLWLALAKARTGDIVGAQRLVAATRGDCYNCLRTRGLIAATARQWGRADYWFARAERQGPSIPFAEENWGRSLLARGDAASAAAKFEASNAKSPHFADPLEGWGEALMLQNHSDQALAKFTEAEKYAPNWGRLHLKWGEALVYAGKADEAKKEFARAAQLDLSTSDKVQLARWAARG